MKLDGGHRGHEAFGIGGGLRRGAGAETPPQARHLERRSGRNCRDTDVPGKEIAGAGQGVACFYSAATAGTLVSANSGTLAMTRAAANGGHTLLPHMRIWEALDRRLPFTSTSIW